VRLLFVCTLLICLAARGLGQQFSDVVPREHWAYDAVLKLKEKGLLVGYPDAKFRGGRNATRYEMAAAVGAAFGFLHLISDKYDVRLNAIRNYVDGFPVDATLTPRREIAALEREIQIILRWGSELDELTRLSKIFEKELAAMGVEVGEMRKDVIDLQKRVTALEKGGT
jgi:hypothetical protein